MDGRQHMTAAEAFYGDDDIVARATSQKAGRRAWTVLTIYRGIAGYIAEIVGESTVPGQERRVRRQGFRDLAKALNWSMFDPTSALFDELRAKVIDYIHEGKHLESGRAFAVPAVQRQGFTAPPKNRLGAALSWLYETDDGKPRLLGDLAAQFSADFGIGREHIDFALQHERGEAPGASKPYPGTLEWVDVFIATLRFFDREAFWANRAAG